MLTSSEIYDIVSETLRLHDVDESEVDEIADTVIERLTEEGLFTDTTEESD